MSEEHNYSMHLPMTSLLDLLCVIFAVGDLIEDWEEDAGSNEALDTPVYGTANIAQA